jgi:fucose permease
LTQTIHRDRLTWLAYLFLAFYSYFINGLGPITPFLKDELGLSYTVSSLHFSAFAAGMLLIGLAGNRVVGRVGRLQAAWIGAFGISASTVVLLAGRSPAVTIGASFAMGLVGTLILVVVPAALSERHGEQRAAAITEANVLASFVAMGAPLMVGLCTRLAGGWRLAFASAACAPIIMRLLLRQVTSEKPERHEEAVILAQRPLPSLYWVYWAALVLAVSVEFCMIYWSANYLEKSLGMAKVDAAQAVSLFLAAMIVGRLTGSRLVHRFETPRVVIVSVLVAGAGFALFWTAGQPLPVLAGLFITGLGVASLYPLILSLAIGAANGDTDQASARGTLASGAAILALPLVLGRLADLVGIRPAYGVVGALLIGVFLIVLFTGSRALSRQAA